MQGKKKVVAALDRLLAGELGARDQYLQQSMMLENWGWSKLAARLAHESGDETRHAQALMERILMLGGTPTTVPAALNVGDDVLTMLNNNLAAEHSVADNVRAAIKLCEAENDYVSRKVLEVLLSDTEHDHIHWLEQQLFLVGQLGLQNYLQSQTA